TGATNLVGIIEAKNPGEKAVLRQNGWERLAAYEDAEKTPEEIFDALTSAEKLISTMRNNKKAVLWLRKYGKLEAQKCTE
ncbi:MAG: hypothetical protein WCT05_16585, partial [Lentisphaeria bacterium]